MHFCHLSSTANVADILTNPLSSEIVHGLLRQYMYRKPRIHKMAQSSTVTLVRREDYTSMNAAFPVNAQPHIGFAAISNSQNIFFW